MIAIFTVLIIIALSILVTRVSAVALTHTGLSRDVARFQARSAFTGVGFTTREAERVTRHPVRRRIAMTLMLLGNAGVATVIASLVVGVIDQGDDGAGLLVRIAILAAGLLALWFLAASPLLDRWSSIAIGWALQRWTDLEVRDYAQLLHLTGDYGVREVRVGSEDWLAEKDLAALSLNDEGIIVLGVQRENGDYVGAPQGHSEVEAGDLLILYGRDEALDRLDARPKGVEGDRRHQEGVADQNRERKTQEEKEARRKADRARSS
jgi:hypothetical protein